MRSNASLPSHKKQSYFDPCCHAVTVAFHHASRVHARRVNTKKRKILQLIYKHNPKFMSTCNQSNHRQNIILTMFFLVFVYNISFVDDVRELMQLLSWDGENTYGLHHKGWLLKNSVVRAAPTLNIFKTSLTFPRIFWVWSRSMW